MGKLLSLPTAITAILIIFFGGLGVIGAEEICNIWAYAIWGIALIWFLGLIFYLPQKVYLRDLHCEYDSGITSNVQGRLYVVLSGFIKARHKDTLQNMFLYLPEYIIEPCTNIPSTPEFDESVAIGSYYEKYKVTFAVDEDKLKNGRKNQKRGKSIDWAILGLRMATTEYITNPFKIPSQERGNMKTQKRKGTDKEKVISAEKFNELLN